MPTTTKPAHAGREDAALLTRIEAKKRTAVDLATAGALSATVLKETLARYEIELAQVRARMVRAEHELQMEQAAQDPGRRASVLSSMAVISAAWAASSVEERRAWLSILCERIEVGCAGLVVTWRTLAELMREEGA